MIVGNANVEWSDEIESDLSREEQAIVDVVETVQLIEEGDGLHNFLAKRALA